MKRQKLWLLILCILSFLGHLILYPKMPDIVPTHWNLSGQVDGYSGKATTLFLAALPALMLLLLHYVPRIDPRRRSYEKHQKAYDIFCTLIVLFLIAMIWITNAYIFGYPVSINRIVPVGAGILLLVTGNYMPQLRTNYTMGIKNPWTLENEYVWKKTHAMGGIVFCIMGILLILCGIIPVKLISVLAFPVIIAGVLFLELYSYLLYRKIQNKE